MYITKKLIKLGQDNIREILNITIVQLLSSIIKDGQYLLIALCVILLFNSKNSGDLIIISISGFIFLSFLYMILEKRIVKAVSINGTKLKKEIRLRLIKKLFSLGPQYTERKRSGDLVNILWQKVEWLNFYYSEYLPKSLVALIQAVFIVSICCIIEWWVGVSLFFCSLVLFLAPILFYPIMKKTGKSEWQESAKFYSDCLDGIQGITTLKAFNANNSHKQMIYDQGEKMRITIMKNLIRTTANSKFMIFFIMAGKYISLLLAAYKTVIGEVTGVELIIIFFLLMGWSDAMERILGSWLKGNKGLTGLDSICELLSTTSKYSLDAIDVEYKNNEFYNLEDGISFKNVYFSYNSNDGNVLEEISFHIPCGTTTALVGSSGSGKSTIAQLLFGFYSVSKGSIFVGGKKINKKSVRDIQSLITVVWQDSHVFHGSCYENILMGKSTATKEEVFEAAKNANIHDFINKLPNGYETVLGDGGTSLSGGEKQRIIIARAFLRNTPILILDEATSSLDRKNEVNIQKCISKLSEGKTVLVIAHRLKTIESADQICVLEKGRINNIGKHKELMLKSSIYKKLMGTQVVRRRYNEN